MEKKYVLALDEGTTSARAILFDRDGGIVSVSQHEFPQIYPQPGWVEHDPLDIYANQYAALGECVAKSGIDPDEIAAVGITNQRETAVVWDKRTGKPIYNAIVWQCRRTADICERLVADGHSDYIAAVTGLRPDAYFSGTKIRWILDHVEGAQERAEAGELLFGTIDTWLVWKLTDGRVHVTDRTNASRTMLYNIETGDWDARMLEILNIPRAMLPEVRSSSEVYGYADIMGARIPISGIAGDQQAALFGQGCHHAGDVKNTYGTGCFMLANTGRERVVSRHGLVTTVAATEAGKPVEYALEGSVFVGGAVVQWLRDELGLIERSSDSEVCARRVADSGGVYVVPAFAGLGAPYWDMHARGIITGLTRGTGRDHIIRASLESIAYQTEDVFRAMEADMGKTLSAMRVDGGASANNLLMQFQSDISDIEVVRPTMTEATAAGAAFLAGLAVDFWHGREDLPMHIENATSFTPSMTDETRRTLLVGWQHAVGRCWENR